MANSIGGKDCMVSFCISAVHVPASLTFVLHLTDFGMDSLDGCLCSRGLENVHPSTRAEAKVEVVWVHPTVLCLDRFGTHYLRVSDCLDLTLLLPADMEDHSTLTYKLGVMDDWEPSVKLSKISFASNYFYDFGMVCILPSLINYSQNTHHTNSRASQNWACWPFTGACFLLTDQHCAKPCMWLLPMYAVPTWLFSGSILSTAESLSQFNGVKKKVHVVCFTLIHHSISIFRWIFLAICSVSLHLPKAAFLERRSSDSI